MSDLLEYKGYSGSVDYSAEDGCLVGEVLFIEGKIAYCGDSISEITEMFQTAVDDYLQLCAERNMEPRKPFKGSFNVRITPELHQRAATAAVKAGLSLNAFIGQAIDEKLNPRAVHHHEHHNTFNIQGEAVQTDTSSNFTLDRSVRQSRMISWHASKEQQCH